jgi:hypothetical protein
MYYYYYYYYYCYMCSVLSILIHCVVLCTVCVQVCTLLLPPGVKPIAFKKISYQHSVTTALSKVDIDNSR